MSFNFIESLPFPLLEGILRLLLAFILGSLIGFEREKRKQPAGFRTHSVLALGSSLMSILSIYIPYAYVQGPSVDPSRIASQVITGIGFLGAGAIIRIGVSIRGLTTAASLWTTAGIGLSVGAGMYVLSILTATLLLTTLSLMSKVEREFISVGVKYTLNISLEPVDDVIKYLQEILGDFKLNKIIKKEGFLSVSIELETKEEELRRILSKLTKEEKIKSVELP
ncbi:MAG: MgtC/SapB family protein [Aquificaceae bacterium]